MRALARVTLAVVLFVLVAPIPGYAPTAVEYAVHPVGLMRGQTARTDLLLPAIQKVREPALVRLMIFELNGDLIGSTEYLLQPGRGTATDLQVNGDGSVRLAGEPAKAFVGEGERLEVVGVVLVGSRTGGARALASLQVFGGDIPRTELILPYIEQDN